jgi:hypothetical protein
VANTNILISTTTVGSGGAANITFSSIPQTYTDLRLIMSVRTSDNSSGRWTQVSINGVTTDMYCRALYTNNSGIGLAYGTGPYFALMNGAPDAANVFSNIVWDIAKYTSTTDAKIIASQSWAEDAGATGAFGTIGQLTWSPSTSAAITSLTISPDQGSFIQYSSISLYGIKNS